MALQAADRQADGAPQRGGGPAGSRPGWPRRPTAVSSRHSRTVTLLKLAVPLTAVGLVLLLMLWAQWSGHDRLSDAEPLVSSEDSQALAMLNARYAGTNRQGLPYLITAEQALQDNPDADLIRLLNPQGDMTTSSGAWMMLSAPEGDYFQASDQLSLFGGVTLFHDSGMTFTSPTAELDLAGNTASGNDPVTGMGPAMTVEGEGFRILDDGTRILFTGTARAILYPAARSPAAQPTGTGGAP